MPYDFLLPDANLSLETILRQEQTVQLVMTTTSKGASCPDCGQVSYRVHSHASRTPADLPLSSLPTQILLKVCRFFCDTPNCQRKTFTQQVPSLLPAYARRTSRLIAAQRSIGLTAGGEAGARLTSKLHMPTSPDSLLRLIRGSQEICTTPPKAVGIDDWAIQRGKTYGTLLVDLETHRPIDLLPDRTANSVSAWLKRYPEIQVVSRDRSNEYAKGVAEGAPQAIQVADRWHLVKNLREALEQYLEENRAYLRAAAGPLESTADSGHLPQPPVPVSSNTIPSTPHVEIPTRPQTPAEQARQTKRIRRKKRYQAVLDLYQQGIGIREIARTLGMARDTVRHYVRAGEFPEWAQRQEKKPGKLTPFVPYLEQRWQAGCHNRMQLWREISQQGFDGTPRLVSRWAARKRLYNEPSIDGAGVRTNSPSWAANKAVWLLMKAEAELNQEEQQALQRMKQVNGQLEQVIALSQQFRTMVRKKQGQDLPLWLDQVVLSGIRPLIRFAQGLKADPAAVSAALTLPWSNGVTEGHVNRLKMIKRQMYGRANFDLLRKRVLLL